MAIEFSQDYVRNTAGIQWEVYGEFDLDENYVTGGYSIDAAQFGLSQITSFTVTSPDYGYEYVYNPVTVKLEVYEAPGGGGAPLSFSGTPMSGHTHNMSTITQRGTITRWRVFVGTITGAYNIGEAFTATGGATGTIADLGTNRFGYNYIDVEGLGPTGEIFSGEDITGTVSGAVSTSTSVAAGRIAPTSGVPIAILGVSISNSAVDFDALYAISVAANNSRITAQANSTYDDFENVFYIANSPGDHIGDEYRVTFLTNPSSSESAGTPAGTISGGGSSGGPLTEVANGTDLSSVINVKFRVVGL